MPSIRLLFVCLLSLSLVVSAWADEPEKVPSLEDAQTLDDVRAYIRDEQQRLARTIPDPSERKRAIFILELSASDRMLELATNPTERVRAYIEKRDTLWNAFGNDIEGAEQKNEAFLKEIAPMGIFEHRSIWHTRFYMLERKMWRTWVPYADYKQFESEARAWIAEQNELPAGQLQFVEKMIEFTQSPQSTLSEIKREAMRVALESVRRMTAGSDPKLYGKTLDNEDFDWKSLRGQYVLIKFTATWCGPCRRQIPDMLEAYQNYHDKGLEIVSVYIQERGTDPVARVKLDVEERKLPWIILSEELARQARQPNYNDFYVMRGVPTMVLVDKEGKIMIPPASGFEWKAKLAEIFE